MRIRRLVTLSVGAAIGAGTMYLLDPEHGPDRRRHARRRALAQARGGATHALRDGRLRAEELVRAAVAGYQESRRGADPALDGGR